MNQTQHQSVNKRTFTVQIPFEVEADSPHEALAKVPIPEGCIAQAITVTPKQQPMVRPQMPQPASVKVA